MIDKIFLFLGDIEDFIPLIFREKVQFHRKFTVSMVHNGVFEVQKHPKRCNHPIIRSVCRFLAVAEKPVLLIIDNALFIMGSLCRYHPEKWGPFVLNDETGERLLFEKFLYLSRRIIPNIVLNLLNNDNVVYVTQKYSINETIKHVGEHEIKELIQKELYAAEEKRRLKR